MSKNVPDKILKLSYSEKEHLNSNFEIIASIIGIRTAQGGPQDVDDSELALNELGDLLLTNPQIYVRGNMIPVSQAIKEFSTTRDQDYLFDIFSAIDELVQSNANLAGRLPEIDESYYDRLLKPLETIDVQVSPEVEKTNIQKEIEKQTELEGKSKEFREFFDKNFRIEEGVDQNPINELGKIFSENITADLYQKNSDSQNLKLINSFNKVLRSKYFEYQESGDRKSLEFYRDFERNLPELMLKYYITQVEEGSIENFDAGNMENEWQRDWISAVKDKNDEYQKQMNFALRQRSYFSENDRKSGGENYDKAAKVCMTCGRFWSHDGISRGVPVNEAIKNEVCRTQEMGATTEVDEKTGEPKTKEGCDIVKNLLTSREMHKGGVGELFEFDQNLSIDLGEEFYNIKTGNLKYIHDEDGDGSLLVADGHKRNINKNIVDFLRKAKELEAQTGNIVFGSSMDEGQYIDSLQNFIGNIQDFIEMSAYFMPQFFAPKLGTHFVEMVNELSENPDDLEIVKFNNTQKYKQSMGYLSEIYGRINAIENGLSPETVGSYNDGTLNVDVLAIYDLWNLVSYAPTGAYLKQGGYPYASTTYHQKEGIPFSNEVEDIALSAMFSRVQAPYNDISNFFNNIAEKIAKSKIGEDPKNERDPLREEEKIERERRIQIHEKRVKAEIYDAFLKSKKITMNILMSVDKKGPDIKEKEFYIPGINFIDEYEMANMIDDYVSSLGLKSSVVSRDPEAPQYWANPKVVLQRYREESERLGYEIKPPEYIEKAIEEQKEEVKTKKRPPGKSVDVEKWKSHQDVFGTLITKRNIKIREENSYPEYVEIIHKLLTLPKAVSQHLMKNMRVETAKSKKIVDFFIINELGQEELVYPDYESKVFKRSNGIVIEPSDVKYEKEENVEIPVITGTALTNPKARQAIALLGLGFSIRDPENFNPSKSFSLCQNATEGGVLRDSNSGGARIFAEHEGVVDIAVGDVGKGGTRRMSDYNPPFFMDFLMNSGATIAGRGIKDFYSQRDYMGIGDFGESVKKEERKKGKEISPDIIPNKSKSKSKSKSKAESKRWYKIAQSLAEEDSSKKYNYVIVTTKYDVSNIVMDSVNNANLNSKSKPIHTIPFMTIVPMSHFGSLDNVIKYASDPDNEYMAIAISEEVENIMKAAGFWPLKSKNAIPQGV